ncbi:hypothetical protein KP806_08095 [Paenibacillus sp. N4]|uniref:hypothetical protein n=1 Tax=Paenibacillus vietnamensis TaxID=2590547 RepID=UPI001CD146A8|nr:hypothetical protein [Paenibacillus vietnamensis]MCA0755007.1 hypothetical protein [Paenibacillus vietnamensis]
MKEKEIVIDHFQLGMSATTAEEMAKLAGECFPIGGRVQEAAGEAFDWHDWYTAWVKEQGPENGAQEPTHLMVQAADTFEATIPWEQLGQAAVLFAQGGVPLEKAGPIRLYVPNGSSKCLNVKSVVRLRLARLDGSGHEEASYGFKRTFSAEDLRMNK